MFAVYKFKGSIDAYFYRQQIIHPFSLFLGFVALDMRGKLERFHNSTSYITKMITCWTFLRDDATVFQHSVSAKVGVEGQVNDE